jgi:hypothetical protein
VTEEQRTLHYPFLGYAALSSGHILSLKTHRVLKGQASKYGYLTVNLFVNGVHHQRSVAKLICRAFYGLPPTVEHEARHKNGVMNDNRPENLVWSTKQETIAARERRGTTAYGEKSGQRKLTERDVREIRWWSKEGFSYTKIGKAYGITTSQASRIVREKVWIHVT